MEIKETHLVRGSLPNDVVASVFANRRLYLVLANYGEKDVAVETAQGFAATQEQEERVGTKWELGPRSLLISETAATGLWIPRVAITRERN